MKPIGCHLIGRFGNQMFQYAYGRSAAFREGRRLHTNAWAGQKIFEIDDPPLEPGMEMLPEHYRQDQESLIYTRRQALEWFAWRPEVAEKLQSVPVAKFAAHARRGDYAACGYPVIMARAIMRAAESFGFSPYLFDIAMEEHPWRSKHFTDELSFVPDFYWLMGAEVLFRANSSFSWWAGTLGQGRVFAPVIEGLTGGMEHDVVPFVEGNWPRLAALPGITDLHLRQE